MKKMSNNSLKDIASRLKWATILRKERRSREEAYRSLAACYEKMMRRMWHRLNTSKENEPNPCFHFNKTNATATFYFEREADGKKSHTWTMGDPNNEQVGTLLKDLNRKTEIPYFISDEIIVATAIASISSKKDHATEEESIKILHDYYATEPYKPLELSQVWMSRLNSTMCNIWQMAPIMKRTMQIAEERGLSPVIAQKLAMEEVKVPELPSCLNSDNGDGRVNMSYPGSFFYTIDHHGMAICKEFPNEYLNLSDYETMKVVASTIYRDLTLNQDLDDLGISGALYFLQEEPEWNGGNLFPWEASQTKRYAVNFDDGESTHQIDVFETEKEALTFMKQEVDTFKNGTNKFYAQFPALTEDGDIYADFELALLDDNGNFQETILFWNILQDYHSPS